MGKIIVLLLGEQPIPNLIPIRHLQPREIVFVYSDRTQKICDRLKKLQSLEVKQHEVMVPAFDILAAKQKLADELNRLALSPDDLLFNLTGGTKIMSIAAFELAQELGAPFVYLQSEGSKSRMYTYQCATGKAILVKDEIIPGVLTINDYVQAYFKDFSWTDFPNDAGGKFERMVYEAINPEVHECLHGLKYTGALDVDLIMRYENQVAIAEVKSGGQARRKDGIGQINSIAAQVFFGTYLKKFLIVDTVWDDTLSNLRELAAAHNITVIEIPSYSQNKTISDTDRKKAVSTILRLLGKKD